MQSYPLKTGQVATRSGKTTCVSLVRHNTHHALTQVSFVLLTLGVLCTGFAKVAVSQPLPLTLAQRSTAPLLQQGQRAFQAGRFADAITIWEQAAQQPQQQGDRLAQATSLTRLAAGYQELGQWDRAQGVIAQSLALLNPAGQPTDAINVDDATTTLLYAQALNTQGKPSTCRGSNRKLH